MTDQIDPGDKFVKSLLIEEEKVKQRMTAEERIAYETLKDLRDTARKQSALWAASAERHQEEINSLIRHVTKGAVISLLLDEPIYHAMHPELRDEIQRLRDADPRPPIILNEE